jgi:hypothetical protein
MRQQIEEYRAALNLQRCGADGLEKQQRELRDIEHIHNFEAG